MADSFSWCPPGPYPALNGSKPVSFDQPDAIAVDKEGNLYIANEGGPNAVQEVTASGMIRTILDRRVEPVRSGHYFGLSLAVGPAGDLLIAVQRRGTIERLSPNGALSVIGGKAGDRRLVDGSSALARFKSPDAIAISRSQVIYIADTRTIRKIRADGSVVTVAGNPSAKDPHPLYGGSPYDADGRGSRAVFMHPAGLAVDQTGNIYVADSYDGEDEGQADPVGVVHKITPNGVVSTIAGTLNMTGEDFDGTGANADFSYISGIAIDPAGKELYVTEPDTPSIRRLDVGGHVTTLITQKAQSDTGIVSPAGIAVAGSQDLYVIDDVALPVMKQEHIFWLHRIVGHTVTTLCKSNARKE